MGWGCRGVTVIGFCLVAHLLTHPVFTETRDGSLEIVGSGVPGEWIALEGSSIGGCRHGKQEAYMHCLEGEGTPRMSFLLVHDLSEHAGGMWSLAKGLWDSCVKDGVRCNVYGMDLGGHGITWEREGGTGDYSFGGWVKQVAGGAEFISSRTADSAVFAVGVGLGGEVVFQVCVDVLFVWVLCFPCLPEVCVM